MLFREEQVELTLQDLSNFTPKQREATRAMYEYLYVLYGGARGEGKSRWLRWALLEFLLRKYKSHGLSDVRALLACETYKALEDRQITKIKEEFPPGLGTLKSTQSGGLGFYLHENLGGGVLALRNLDDPLKYKSAEFAAIGVDELTMNPKRTFDVLRGSLRWPNLSHTPFIAATNPGGVGHAWVKDLWIDKNFAPHPELAASKAEFHFIQSLPQDNPYLTESYLDILKSLPPGLRKAWLEGNWGIFEGMAFPSFSRATHVLNEPIELPEDWPRWRALDWGFSKPSCCLWFCKNPDNDRIFVYREFYAANLTDLQQARTIKEYSPVSEKVYITYADPSMWARQTMANQVSSTADEFRKEGILLTKADNDRLSGKRKVQRLLQPLADGIAGLLIFPQCENLIRTIPSLALDKVRVEDVDTNQEDHAYDSLRYGLTKKESHAKRDSREWPDWEDEFPIARINRLSDIF